jgi:hypothetical protein
MPRVQGGEGDSAYLQDPQAPIRLGLRTEDDMDTTTLLIIIVVLLVLGGGWYGRGLVFSPAIR